MSFEVETEELVRARASLADCQDRLERLLVWRLPLVEFEVREVFGGMEASGLGGVMNSLEATLEASSKFIGGLDDLGRALDVIAAFYDQAEDEAVSLMQRLPRYDGGEGERQPELDESHGRDRIQPVGEQRLVDYRMFELPPIQEIFGALARWD